MTVTDEMLILYADGEADAETRAAVEAALAADPTAAQRLAAHQTMRARFAQAFGEVMEEPPPQRLIDAVLNEPKAVQLADRRHLPTWAPWAGMAACLVLGLGLGFQLRPQPQIGPDLAAHGALAQALDTHLASAGQEGQAVRIGVSFKAKDGRYCRSFQTSGSDALAGLACRDAKAWKVQMAMAQPAEIGAFRTAASAPPAIMGAVDQLIEGSPLDAAGEQAAKTRGWR